LKYIKSLRDRHFSKSKIKELLDVDDFFDDYVYPYDEFRSCSIDDDDEDDCPTL
jgi:DNA-binding transcriptional MerR regulator